MLFAWCFLFLLTDCWATMVEISNICCVLPIRDNAKKTGHCVVWYKICVTCMNFLAFYIVLYSFQSYKLVSFHVVVDNLKQFERRMMLFH